MMKLILPTIDINFSLSFGGNIHTLLKRIYINDTSLLSVRIYLGELNVRCDLNANYTHCHRILDALPGIACIMQCVFLRGRDCFARCKTNRG